MLVLSRRPQEGIVIGDEIEITVLSVRGKYVRLGIECDRSIPIRREELPLQRKKVRAATRRPCRYLDA